MPSLFKMQVVGGCESQHVNYDSFRHHTTHLWLFLFHTTRGYYFLQKAPTYSKIKRPQVTSLFKFPLALNSSSQKVLYDYFCHFELPSKWGFSAQWRELRPGIQRSVFHLAGSNCQLFFFSILRCDAVARSVLPCLKCFLENVHGSLFMGSVEGALNVSIGMDKHVNRASAQPEDST